jgi:dTDP-4-amino-4,6-dideoxygalactose transaminase
LRPGSPARYKGKLVGTFGNAATFSLPGKLGAYGDAGCIVTEDNQLADWTATFARHGGKGEHNRGYQQPVDGLQAAILLAKLPHLASWTESRWRVADRYTYPEEIEMVQTPQIGPDRDHVYHLYVIRTDKRDELKKHLAAAGVTTALNYPKALPFYPAYAYLNHAAEDFPVAHGNQSPFCPCQFTRAFGSHDFPCL